MITVARIQGRVASHFGFKAAVLRGPRRFEQLTRARAVAMYMTRELTDLSFPEIGRAFGGKHHTTVMYAHRRVLADQGLLATALALELELNPGTPAPVSA